MLNIKPMLAADYSKRPYIDLDRFPGWLQPKLDGVRCIIDTDGQLYSRSLKHIPNAYVRSTIHSCVQHLHQNDDTRLRYPIDGELLLGDPTAEGVFNRSQSAFMSMGGVPHNFRFYAFDIVDPVESYAIRKERFELVCKTFEQFMWFFQTPTIGPIFKQSEIDYFSEQFVGEGHEGAIYRWVGGKYKGLKAQRSTLREGNLIKIKNFIDAEATIIGFDEMMHNANEATINETGHQVRSSHKAGKVPAGVLGALVVEMNGTTFRIGTGFDMAARQAIWNMREQVNGKTVKFKYMQHGTVNAPRHPVFIGFRETSDM